MSEFEASESGANTAVDEPVVDVDGAAPDADAAVAESEPVAEAEPAAEAESAAEAEPQVDPRDEFRDALIEQPGGLVRRSLICRLRESGEAQPGKPPHIAVDGRVHPRHPGASGRCRRDQAGAAQTGHAQQVPGLRTGPNGPDRRVLVHGAAHPWGHRVRRARAPAHATHARRGHLDPLRRAGDAPPRRLRQRQKRRPLSTSRSGSRSPSSTAPSPRCRRPSTRSTPMRRNSRSSSPSSAARRPSSFRSTKSKNSDRSHQ